MASTWFLPFSHESNTLCTQQVVYPVAPSPRIHPIPLVKAQELFLVQGREGDSSRLPGVPPARSQAR